MISPASRLLWMAALVLLPSMTVAGLVPALRWLGPAPGVVCCAVAAWDAWQALRRSRELRVDAATADCKWFKDRPQQVRFSVTMPCEVALDLPSAIRAEQPIRVADGAATFTCVPEARGRFHIQRCFLRIDSPWRLWRLDANQPLDISIKVFPDLEGEPGAALLFRQKQLGLRTQRPIGRGREFERLREYAAGDSYEDIYWKATARRGAPVVKVFQIERTQDVYVVLDTSLRSGPPERMDRFVRGALMVALATQNEGDNFGLVTFDRQVTRFVPAGRGKRHFAHCRDAIFDLASNPVAPDFNEIFSFLQLRVRRRALLLFVTDLEDPIAAEAFLSGARMLTGKHVVVVASVVVEGVGRLFRNPDVESVAEVNERLAGHLEWASLQRTWNKLHRIGVATRSLGHETVGIDLVAEYSAVKRRQLL